MAIDYDRLCALDIPAVTQSYTERDSILYALGVGLGHDPTDEAQLAFLLEDGLKVLPSMACVLGHPAMWLRELDTGVNFHHVVHGEQGLRLHRPLRPAGRVTGKTRVTDIVDKGAGKGAIIYTERTVTDADTGQRIATLEQTTFCRADGGFGGPQRPSRPPPLPPDRSPDYICDLGTRPEAALIYRLSGDRNPLHAEPETARIAGFPRPILHGLATFGIASHAILRTLCDYDSGALVAMSGRFSAPVFPGETIRTELWRSDRVLHYRARIIERDIVAISNGEAELAR